MKHIFITLLCLFVISISSAQVAQISSPNNKLKLKVFLEQSKPFYSVTYDDKAILEQSPLGLTTNEGSFSKNLHFVNSLSGHIDKTYSQEKIKKSQIQYQIGRAHV